MNPRRPRMGSRELMKLLQMHGFEEARITGSHLILQHRTSKKIAVVPLGRKDLPTGTLHAILKQAGIEETI